MMAIFLAQLLSFVTPQADVTHELSHDPRKFVLLVRDIITLCTPKGVYDLFVKSHDIQCDGKSDELLNRLLTTLCR